MDTMQNKTQKSTIRKSIEDTEIENLDKKRIKTKNKNKKQKSKQQQQQKQTNKALEDKVEYTELNKLVKTKLRTRAWKKRKVLKLETLEAR